MRISLLLSIISLCSFCNLFAQVQNETHYSNKNADSQLPNNQILFEFVLADMINLPNEPFSAINAEQYLNILESWIKNNPSQYNQIISGNTKKYVLYKKDFDSFTSDKQLQIKQWCKSIDPLFTNQQKYLPENKKVYLLGNYEYNYLKNLINK
jgi:hypothetical protein